MRRVLKSLEENGLAGNTVVVFSSDNGAPGYIGLPEVNKPYRGWKLTFFEGFVQLLQAYVFTLLSALYIGGALSDEH